MRITLASSLMLIALLSGCECNSQTGINVDLRSNFVPGIEFDAVRTEVWGRDNRSPEVSTTTIVRWTDPVEDGVRVAEAPGLAPGSYTVSATLLRAGSAIAQRSVIISFDVSTIVTVLVTRDCLHVICPDGLTCLVGVCVPQDCLDGSIFDGCPTVTCSRDDMCDPPDIECTEALCVEGRCHPFPNHEECGSAEWCNPDDGCRVFPGWPSEDTGSDMDAGTTGCRSDDACNDGNPCTDDLCLMGLCSFPGNSRACDDGMFCNGPDQCSGSACSVPSGDPCPGASTCNELADTCEGCATGADCPTDLPGPWTACDFGGATCATDGTHSRQVTLYTCVAAECVGATMTENGACSRTSRDGMSCGSSGCGGWGGCDYSDACDESASQSRTCTDPVCMGGSCVNSMRDERQPCSRSTGGMGCGAGSYCDGWGSCDYSDACDQDGTQTRTCHDFRCGGGSCRDSPRGESQGCSRNTETAPCGSNPTYCGRTTTCHVCRGGSCAVNDPHFDADCNPSCGVAIGLCGGAGICCSLRGACTPVGGGPFADCVQCCAEGFCF